MKLFKELTHEEKEAFKKWAHENYKPFHHINGLWHPVVQEECVRMNREASLKILKGKEAA